MALVIIRTQDVALAFRHDDPWHPLVLASIPLRFRRTYLQQPFHPDFLRWVAEAAWKHQLEDVPPPRPGEGMSYVWDEWEG